MMVSEETAKRIAAALERLAAAYEQEAPDYADGTGKSAWLSQVMCFRCFPPHPMDWHNPCEKYR
jgi:hypothetical protein